MVWSPSYSWLWHRPPSTAKSYSTRPLLLTTADLRGEGPVYGTSAVSVGDEGKRCALISSGYSCLILPPHVYACPQRADFPLSSFDVIPLPHVLSLLPVKLRHSSSLSLILTATLPNSICQSILDPFLILSRAFNAFGSNLIDFGLSFCQGYSPRGGGVQRGWVR